MTPNNRIELTASCANLKEIDAAPVPSLFRPQRIQNVRATAMEAMEVLT